MHKFGLGGQMENFKDSFASKFTVSSRQAEVAELVAKGLTNVEIGEALHITEKGVKYHTTIIYRSARVKGRKELKELITAEFGQCQQSIA
jgi:DNA-binding NarL/FixJ family response regulator